jgi:glycosyltransferase involved in cell wall biosynthesis
MKIAVLSPAFPGPTHTFIARELKAMKDMGVEVSIFSTRRPQEKLQTAGEFAFLDDDVCYLRLPGPSSLFNFIRSGFYRNLAEVYFAARAGGSASLKDFLICFPFAISFAEACRRQGVTHVHAHMTSRSALTAAIASRISGIPYSITHHGRLEDFGSSQNFKWRHAAFGIVITQQLLDELRAAIGDAAPENLIVQPMGVDSTRFKRREQYRPQEEGDGFRLFSCGRLHPQKGHDVLIKAVAQLVDEGEDIHLEIAGGDPLKKTSYKQELEDLIVQLGLQNNVKLSGFLSEEEVVERLSHAHAFALASRFEPFGVVYLEAMSCGVPTIGIASGGIGEIIDDGKNGFLVPQDDSEALAGCILRLIHKPGTLLRISKEARRSVERKFPIDASAKLICDQVTKLQKVG